MIGRKTAADGFGIVVGAARHFGAAAVVTGACNTGLFEIVVIPFAAFGAGVAPGDARDHRSVIHLQADCRIDALAGLGQQRIQRLCLNRCTGKAVQDNALGTVRLCQAVAQDVDDDLVADQPAGLHHRLGGLACLGPGRHRCAQQVAGGQLNKAKMALEFAGLRALASPRRAQQDQYGRAGENCGVHFAAHPLLARFSIRSSTTDGSARVEVSPREPKSFSAILRRMRRMILPDRVFGRPGAH
mmetsp:Transcript_2388/g.3153  ORF Transcript_2388/g.3153 Transcript_2388/m.3153 type:complete len:243 (+) Transcript_2388:458-1186(+)